MLKNNVRMHLLRHLLDVGDLILFDGAEHLMHFIQSIANVKGKIKM